MLNISFILWLVKSRRPTAPKEAGMYAKYEYRKAFSGDNLKTALSRL